LSRAALDPLCSVSGKEISPRISGVSGQIQGKIYPGAWIKLTGNRLTADVRITKSGNPNIVIKPEAKSVTYYDEGRERMRIDFQLSSTTPVGSYYINVYSATGVKSPTVPFRVVKRPVAADGLLDPVIVSVSASTTDIYPGSWVKLLGKRLSGDVRITKHNYPNIIIKPVARINADASRVDFKLPPEVTVGAYYLNVYSDVGRNSNTMPLRVVGSNSEENVQPTITFVSPSGGETFKSGQQVIVRYDMANFLRVANVQIQLNKGAIYPGGPYNPVGNATNYMPAGHYTFTIPADAPSGDDYSFMINSDYPNTETSAHFQSNIFSIVAPDTSASGRPRIEGEVLTGVSGHGTGHWLRIRGARLTNNVVIRKYGGTATTTLSGGIVSGVPGNAAAFLDIELNIPVGSYQLNIIGSDGTVSNTVRLNVTAETASSRASQIAAVASAIQALVAQLKVQ
jgi:hypothetical protein